MNMTSFQDLFAEIERLRAENAQQRADWATLEAAGNAELDRLRAENAGLRSRLTVLDAWASDLADSITSLRMRNIFPATEPGAGT